MSPPLRPFTKRSPSPAVLVLDEVFLDGPLAGTVKIPVRCSRLLQQAVELPDPVFVINSASGARGCDTIPFIETTAQVGYEAIVNGSFGTVGKGMGSVGSLYSAVTGPLADIYMRQDTWIPSLTLFLLPYTGHSSVAQDVILAAGAQSNILSCRPRL